MTKEALTLALEALQAVQPECDDFHHKKKEMHDWSETCMPLERYNKAITAIKEALAQPEPYKQGYADAMNWKVQNHLEHLPAAQNLAEWKLVPIEPTREMLEAMDECSMEGYDERLYAGHAASVYMAAVDVAPSAPEARNQEPVALQMDVIVVNLVREGINKHRARELAEHFIKHTTPPQRKPLTDEQIDKAMAENKQTLIDAADNYWKMRRAYARIIEAAHGITSGTDFKE